MQNKEQLYRIYGNRIIRYIDAYFQIKSELDDLDKQRRNLANDKRDIIKSVKNDGFDEQIFNIILKEYQNSNYIDDADGLCDRYMEISEVLKKG